jgi:KDO2-lipid IV(A) lauroyltransferase
MLAIPLFLILKILPFRVSSYLCGGLMYLIAPLTSYNNRVKKHLKIAFPQKSIHEINKLTRQHWFMLGQTIGEMPHINHLIKIGHLETEGLEKIKNGPAILVGAHMGNWEFLLRVGDLAGRRAGYVFRPINNWILNKIQIHRNKDANADFYRKGRLAAIGMASKLKNAEVVGLTGDQLLREGIQVPFFGIKTPTPQAAAVMALKWNVPIYMVRIERFKGIKFKMTIEERLQFPKNLDKEKAIFEITRLISHRIEEWIIDRPEQWLWAHRRWGK